MPNPAARYLGLPTTAPCVYAIQARNALIKLSLPRGDGQKLIGRVVVIPRM